MRSIHAGTRVVIFWMIIATLALQGCQPGKTRINREPMSISMNHFGNVDGRDVVLYTIESPAGMTVKVTNYGGIITSLSVPDRTGRQDDVVLGFDSLAPYLAGHPYFGAIVGRYANRIADGQFTINGKPYQLARNNGENHLHGGEKGFDKAVWDHHDYNDGIEAGVTFEYLSPDGEEGYPGNLRVEVTYAVTTENELRIKYRAETDQPTIINLSHHSYFNLLGVGKGDVLNHQLMIDADRYTVVNDRLIPTGELRPVEGSPMDFTSFKEIGRDIGLVPGGYDHNFVLNNRGEMGKVAELREPTTGRKMEVFTTEPGMQFYSGNFLDGTLTGKTGKAYQKHSGLCLETQHFPDSPNQPSFPPALLLPGEQYFHEAVYHFSTF